MKRLSKGGSKEEEDDVRRERKIRNGIVVFDDSNGTIKLIGFLACCID